MMTFRQTYDEATDAVYIYLRSGSTVIARTVEVRPGVLIDFDENEKPVGIELLDVKTLLED